MRSQRNSSLALHSGGPILISGPIPGTAGPSPPKRNKTLSILTTWMDHKGIMTTKTSQRKRQMNAVTS